MTLCVSDEPLGWESIRAAARLELLFEGICCSTLRELTPTTVYYSEFNVVTTIVYQQMKLNGLTLYHFNEQINYSSVILSL